MQVIDLDKKPVFVLTYNEQDLWCANYQMIIAKFLEYQFIIIDNGKQQKLKSGANTQSIIATEQNIVVLEDNWIFKVAKF